MYSSKLKKEPLKNIIKTDSKDFIMGTFTYCAYLILEISLNTINPKTVTQIDFRKNLGKKANNIIIIQRKKNLSTKFRPFKRIWKSDRK